MRRMLFVAALLIGVSVSTHAAPHWKIVFSADAGLSSCALAGDGSGLVQVHMFHLGDTPTSAVQFAGYPPACWAGAIYLGDVVAEPFLVIGSTQDPIGLSVSYRGCRDVPIYLGYMNFYGVPASACCEFRPSRPIFAGGPGWNGDTQAVGVTCNYDGFAAEVAPVIVNANSSCPCDQPLGIQTKTWGSIKALYR